MRIRPAQAAGTRALNEASPARLAVDGQDGPASIQQRQRVGAVAAAQVDR